MNNLKKLLLSLVLCIAALPVFACVKSGDTSQSDSLASLEESLTSSEEISSPDDTSSDSEGDITDPIKLGEAIQGTKQSFLEHINTSIAFKNGTNRYDFVAKIKADDTRFVGRLRMMIEKENDTLTRFYVNDPLSDVNAYSDLQYVYVDRKSVV